MPLIWGFKKTNEPNTFEDGKVYNGEDGKTYSANISLQPDGKLRLRGLRRHADVRQDATLDTRELGEETQMDMGIKGRKAIVCAASKGLGEAAPRRWPARASIS